MIKIGITENGDPAFSNEWIENYNKLGVSGAVVISKGLPLKKGREFMIENANRILFHATTTGMGGTVLEPHVLPWQKRLDNLETFITDGFPRDHIIIRVDPIHLTEKGIKKAMMVMDKAAEKGFTAIKYSYLDVYRKVEISYVRAGLPIPPKADDAIAKVCIDKLQNHIAQLEKEYKIHFSSCAEKSPHREGCISSWVYEKLGLDPKQAAGRKGQRSMCDCCAGKTELLPYSCIAGCKHGCLYCYWRKV